MNIKFHEPVMPFSEITDTLFCVGEFHQAFEFPPAPGKPCVQRLDSYMSYELALAASALREVERRFKKASAVYETAPPALLHPQLQVSELAELFDAMARRDMVECLDACCDLRYVNDGAVHALGLTPVFYEGFRLVHESNMSKLNPEGKVVKDETGKVMKGDWYKPVKLEHLIP